MKDDQDVTVAFDYLAIHDKEWLETFSIRLQCTMLRRAAVGEG